MSSIPPSEGEGEARKLAELRDRIDAIDAEVHRLLIERGSVIDTLIHVKGTSRPGAAFRPGREAEMMRRLVARHDGVLPLMTVEHLWREIISTFTRMQATFDVAIDTSVEPARMQDLARFYFGFSVKLMPLPDAKAVVARVRETGDLGLVALAAKGVWWRGLGRPNAPQIMAVLPHLRAPERPADLPAFVISPKLSDPTPPDIRILAVSAKGALKAPKGTEILVSTEEDGRSELLLAVPAAYDVARFGMEAGGRIEGITEIGGTAAGIAVDGEASLLYQKPAQART
jgi:chorismate mutase/prephenate dehydratase